MMIMTMVKTKRIYSKNFTVYEITLTSLMFPACLLTNTIKWTIHIIYIFFSLLIYLFI